MSHPHLPSPAAPHPLAVPRSELGEGPRWWDGRLTWVDITAGQVHHWSEGAHSYGARFDDTVSLVVPRAGGGELVAVGATVRATEADGESWLFATIDSDPAVRCNDGTVGPDGALYIGTMRRDVTGRQGKLVRVDPDGSVEIILTGVGISNGIAWSPDGGRSYYVDTIDGTIAVLDVKTGVRVTFVEIDGRPDGLTVDSEGHIWLADWDRSRLLCFTPQAALCDTIELPLRQPTACTFGGPDLTDLFVTSAAEGLSTTELERHPLSGRVVQLHDLGHGLPLVPFAG